MWQRIMQSKQSLWWVYVVAAIAMLPALLLRDYTPDNELRYLSIVDEALSNGSFWCFYNHGAVYADKPPLYFWLMMVGRCLFGAHYMIVYAMMSFIPMMIIARVMDGIVCTVFTIGQRRTALLMLFTCAFFPVMGVTMRMDMLMTLWIVLALREVWRMANGKPTYRHGALLGLYAFLALFTKGPFGIIFPLLASWVWLIYTKRAHLIFRIWNWAAWGVILAGCAMWFGGVYYEGGTDYLNNLLFHQTIDRAHNAFHHKRPFYYYLIAIWYVMAPWSLLMLYQSIRYGRIALAGNFRHFTLLTALTILIVLSVISSKLNIYLLPAIPFAVYWSASMPIGAKLTKAVRIVAYCLLSIVFAGCMAFPWINPRIGYGAVANMAAAYNPTAVYVDKSVRRGENIDAYFNGPIVKVVDMHAADFALPAGVALIFKDEHKKLTVKYESDK